MSKSKKYIFDEKRSYEWLVLSQTYLQNALINARMLMKKLITSEYAIKDDPTTPLQYCLKEIYGDEYHQQPEYLIFPVLYNFKHGMELYLKSILGIDTTQFPHSHNLVDLLTKADEYIDDKNLKAIIEKYAYCRIFLPTNQCLDSENMYERYPQGNIYDTLDLFPAESEGSTEERMTAVITREKVAEVINDISYFYTTFRKATIAYLESKKPSHSDGSL